MISSKPTSGQLPEPASGVGRSLTADESHAEPHAANNCRVADDSAVTLRRSSSSLRPRRHDQFLLPIAVPANQPVGTAPGVFP